MKRKETISAVIKTLILGALAGLFILPLVWMFFSSFKHAGDIFGAHFQWLPKEWRWQNYVAVWTDSRNSMFDAYRNTGYIAIMSIICQLTFASMAAYAFAKINFKGKNFIFTMFLTTMMIPFEVTLIPRWMMFKSIGLYNNHWAIILPHWFTASGMFMLRQFYMGLPNDLMEAAKIDGASHPQIFARIMLPLTKSALISQMILTFVNTWNEYMAPLVFLVNKKMYTLSQNIKMFLMEDYMRYDYAMAASCSAILPVIIIFIFCQKYFVEGIATSGVKG